MVDIVFSLQPGEFFWIGELQSNGHIVLLTISGFIRGFIHLLCVFTLVSVLPDLLTPGAAAAHLRLCTKTGLAVVISSYSRTVIINSF